VFFLAYIAIFINCQGGGGGGGGGFSSRGGGGYHVPSDEGT